MRPIQSATKLTLLAAALAVVSSLCAADEPRPAMAEHGPTRVPQKATTAPATPADADYAAIEKLWESFQTRLGEPMTLRERGLIFEAHFLAVREKSLAFLERHPNDPRRWNVIARLVPFQPQFVKEWTPGPEDEKALPKVTDKAAAAAWKIKVKELQDGMATAKDVPAELQAMVGERAKMESADAAFQKRWASGHEIAPDFPLQDLAGKTHKLSDYRGKIVILDFWATWCAPCIASMPHNQTLASTYRDQDVVVLAVCVSDQRKKFETWVKANQAKLPDINWGYDSSGAGKDVSRDLYGVMGIPAQFVLDREGKVLAVVTGFGDNDRRLEVALAKAGVKVDPAILAEAAR